MERKKCRICGKGLCIYNKTGECYHHNDKYIDEYSPVTICTSYDGTLERRKKEFIRHEEERFLNKLMESGWYE